MNYVSGTGRDRDSTGVCVFHRADEVPCEFSLDTVMSTAMRLNLNGGSLH